MKAPEMSRTDYLALERTKLANERTFLAYFRTAIVFLSSGFAILKIEAFLNIIMLGYFLIIITFVVLFIGVVRFIYVKRRINRYYN